MPRNRWTPVVLLLVLLLGGGAWMISTQRPQPQQVPVAVPVSPPPAGVPHPIQRVDRVKLKRAALGPYGTFERKGAPAWDLSRDPKFVAEHGNGQESVLVLRCDCGKIIRLLGHTVADDGTLSPSLWHDVPECGWHVMGRLEGWAEREQSDLGAGSDAAATDL